MMVRIGHCAEANDIGLAAHCPLGPITLAANLQVDALCHNAFIQEQGLDMHYNQGADMNDYLMQGSRFVCTDSFLPIPAGPSHGIEVNKEFVIAQAKIGHR